MSYTPATVMSSYDIYPAEPAGLHLKHNGAWGRVLLQQDRDQRMSFPKEPKL
jgi:hypothetical protein